MKLLLPEVQVLPVEHSKLQDQLQLLLTHLQLVVLLVHLLVLVLLQLTYKVRMLPVIPRVVDATFRVALLVNKGINLVIYRQCMNPAVMLD